MSGKGAKHMLSVTGKGGRAKKQKRTTKTIEEVMASGSLEAKYKLIWNKGVVSKSTE